MVEVDPILVGKVVGATGALVAGKETLNALLLPSAKVVGDLLARTLGVLVAPANGTLHVFEMLGGRVAEILAEDPKNEIVQPGLQIAAPLLMSYAVAQDVEELRELFARLLATAMSAETQTKAHPGFVGALGQMTANDARLIRALREQRHQNGPSIQVAARKTIDGHPSEGVYEVLGLLTELSVERPTAEELPLCFDSLERLGIARRNRIATLAGPGLYEPLLALPALERFKTFAAERGWKVELNHESIEITDFGIAFLDACIGAKR